jgi:hypothetical protein
MEFYSAGSSDVTLVSVLCTWRGVGQGSGGVTIRVVKWRQRPERGEGSSDVLWAALGKRIGPLTGGLRQQ